MDVRRLVIFWMIFGWSLAKGQPEALLSKKIYFESLPEALGLSQRSINCILQDRDGLLWIGTWSGLIQYDGYSTKLYRAADEPGSLKSNKITSIIQDGEGTIWIGSRMAGLFKYDKTGDRFQQYKHEGNLNSLSNNNVWTLLADDQGALWIGTENGLNRLDIQAEKFAAWYPAVGDPSSLNHPFITDIFLGKTSQMWVATERGLNRMKNDNGKISFERLVYDKDPGNHDLHNYIYTVFEKDGVVWMATKLGLKKFQNGTWSNFLQEPGLPSFSFFRTIYPLDLPHAVILVGGEMGLGFFDSRKEQFVKFVGNYDEQANLTHNTVLSIYLDQSEVLWIGTKKGLNKFDTHDKGFQRYPTSSFDTTKSIISAVAGGNGGSYWVSTLGGGLYQFKFNGSPKFERYKIVTGSMMDFTDFIQTMHVDMHKRLWVGTAGGGLYAFSSGINAHKEKEIRDFKNFSTKSPAPFNLSDDYVMSITEAGDGAVWVGTWSGGLNKVRDNEIIQYKDPLLKAAPLVELFQDEQGVLWIGTRGKGLIRAEFNEDQDLNILRYQHKEEDSTSLSNDFINVILQGSKGDLWIGTEGGLDLFDHQRQTFRRYPIHSGTEQEVVVGLLEDSESRLWVSHWTGLSVINPLDTTFEARHYDQSDRIQDGFFYNNVCFADDTGNLFFGGADGLNVIDPGSISKNPFEPKVVLKDFRIFNKPVRVNEPYDGKVILKKTLDQTRQIWLKHYENSLSFELVALHYAAPEKNNFAYKLDGFDPGWRYTEANQRYINYTNLQDGDYVLKVKASNNDGVWGTEKELRILIAPPWWRTTWAIGLYALIVILILYAFRRLILMRANFINNLKLERLEKQNLERLNRAKLQFFTNISHEFRTPLTLIAGPLQHILDSGEANRFMRDQLMIINQNTQRLLRLVGQLLDFRKADGRNLHLKVAEGNLVKFLKEIQLSFLGLANSHQVDLKFQASSNVIRVWYDRDQLEKVFFNLLSNAFKYTPKGGAVSIGLVEYEDRVDVLIEDSGSGIRPENFENVFKRFFSQDEEHHGIGIGLALAKSLVDLHYGEIRVKSEEGKFTRFIVSLKLGQDHFDRSEIIYDFEDSEAIATYPDIPVFSETEPEGDNKTFTTSDLASWPKLLIVEDNADVRTYVKSIFKGQYIILEAEDGQSALDLALEEMPDLVISDVMMPVMDGIAFCKTLKEDIKTSHIPVILLTARTSLIFKVEGLESGADDYVTKPFNPQLLRLKVRNIIKSRESLKKEFRDSEVLKIEPKRVTLTSKDEQFIQAALESVESNMSNSEYTVEDLWRDTGMSRMQLYRKLKALTGQSANEFIRTIRLKRAAQLIEQNELTIAEVTYEVGFSDLPYFRSCFKKQFGVNPSEYSKGVGKEEL